MIPVIHPTPVDDLIDRLTAEMRDRWKVGDRTLTEDVLARNPHLRFDRGAIGELIFEEICLRRECGETGISAEVLRRFPDLAPQIRVLLAVRDALEHEQEPTDLGAGERVGDYVIVRELGRGLRGRVYLATQSSLADRSVVLKITRRANSEHRTLAQLQHTNVVPVYATFDDPVRNIRVIGMPDFGGGTLAQVLDRLRPTPPAQRNAAGLWAALAGRSGGPNPPGWWARSDYVEIVCRIGICIAEALQFAHERNVIHMDVKPSNVLITAEGQPMLLDFHLAREPIRAGDPAPLVSGGTDSYLSPEHRAVLEAVRHNRTVRCTVDGRTDIYSLGVALYEALTGRIPEPASWLPLTRLNPHVSPGLSDVVARCLAPRPEDRYREAAGLAEDLRRHLGDKPLLGVRNNVAERWRKWRRRRPHAVGTVSAFAVLVLAAVLALGYIDRRTEQARSALVEGKAELANRNFVAARGAFQRGLAVEADLPASGRLTAELNRGVREVTHAEHLAELHTTAERLRGLLGTNVISAAELAAAEPLGRLIRNRRAELFTAVGSAASRSVQQQARADAVDLILLWSHLNARLAPSERASAARQEALILLSEAERALGPHPALARDRAEYLELLNRPEEARLVRRQAEEMIPQSATDHIALGCGFFRDVHTGRAATEFNRTVELDPGSYWGWYYLGRCHVAECRFTDAAITFGTCIGVDPKNPAAYIQLAHTHIRLGQINKATLCLDCALRLEPENSAAIELRNEIRRIQ